MIRQLVRHSFCRLPYVLGSRPTNLRRLNVFNKVQGPCIHFRSLATDESRSQSSKKSPLLSARTQPSLANLAYKQVRAGTVDLNAFSVAEVARRLPTLSDADWSEYFSVHAVKKRFRILRGRASDLESPRLIRDGACEWLARNMDRLQPKDFNFFLRYLTRPEMRLIPQAMPDSVHKNVLQWLVKNLAALTPQNFFEITKYKAAHSRMYGLFGKENPDDIAMIISRGLELVEESSEIIHILELLRVIEEYIQGQLPVNDSRLALYSQKLLEIMEKKELPANWNDLHDCLMFLSESTPAQLKGEEKVLTNRALFRRYAEGNSAAWKWLRNSIELVFEKNDHFADMRQIAAVVAVRAYKWKAVHFSPDDVNRFLKMAAEPFLTNPALFFEPKSEKELYSLKKSYAFVRLITAIRSAIASDLSKLSVHIDDAYWKKFFAMVEKEAPKLGKNVNALRDLVKISPPLSENEKRFLTLPSNKEVGSLLNKFTEKDPNKPQ